MYIYHSLGNKRPHVCKDQQGAGRSTDREDRSSTSRRIFGLIQPIITSKKQIDFLAKLDVERMIKIKDGELRSKLDILNEKMASF